jgi:hypothetical protein
MAGYHESLDYHYSLDCRPLLMVITLLIVDHYSLDCRLLLMHVITCYNSPYI